MHPKLHFFMRHYALEKGLVEKQSALSRFSSIGSLEDGEGP